jgi:acyl-CoA synthetase (NDP forming)
VTIPVQASSAVTARSRLAAVAGEAGMAVCGAGCMGFVNVARGLRAVGYLEPDPLPAGPVALVTHSGSVFSALLRARRGFGAIAGAVTALSRLACDLGDAVAALDINPLICTPDGVIAVDVLVQT